jgi:uncharacterized protein (DUF305 family)
MMTQDEMHDLEAMSGEGIEERWLEMMIEHHEGAIELAGTQVEHGRFPDAVKMAKSIESSPAAEIEQMQGLLGS